MKSKRSSPKFSSNSMNLLSNKYVLYASFFFAIVTAANYLLRNNFEAVAIFIIVGFLTTYFSKNMIVVLLTTTILTNFIVMFKNRRFSMMEGLTTKETEDLKTKMEESKAAMDKETDDTKKAALKVTYETAKKAYEDALAKSVENAAKANAALDTYRKSGRYPLYARNQDHVELVDFNGNIKPYKGVKFSQEVSDEQLKSLAQLLKNVRQLCPDIPQWNGLTQEKFDLMFPSKGTTYRYNLPGIYSHCSITTGKADILPTPKMINFLKRVRF